MRSSGTIDAITRGNTAYGRKGVITAQVLFVMPLIMGILFATLEFSMLFLARQELTVASREGARVAAVGGNAQEVDQAVHLFLGSGRLSVATVTSVLTDSTGAPITSGNPVQVIVQLPATQAAPDLLRLFGISFNNKIIAASTILRKE